jgi:hypothetical protein
MLRTAQRPIGYERESDSLRRMPYIAWLLNNPLMPSTQRCFNVPF